MINFALLIDWDFFLGKARPYDTLDQSDQYRFDLGVDWLDLGFDQSKSWCYRRHSQLGPQRPPLHCRLVVQVFRHFLYQMVYTVSGKHTSKNKPTSNKFFSGNSLWRTPPEAPTARMDISSLHKHRVTIRNCINSPHTRCTLNCYSPQLQVLILFRMP